MKRTTIAEQLVSLRLATGTAHSKVQSIANFPSTEIDWDDFLERVKSVELALVQGRRNNPGVPVY